VSPSRARSRRAPQRRHYSRKDITIAVLGALAVVVGTALAIWMLRPGDAVTPGTGGLAHRQPRAVWLVVGAFVFVIVGIVLIRRSPQSRRRESWLVPAVVGVAILGAVVAGFLWPSGLLRHYQSLTPPPSTPIQSGTQPRPTTPTTGATSSSTAAAPTTATTGG
jgi:hypothetical protein